MADVASYPRLAFLLKEVNDKSGVGGRDLRDYVRKWRWTDVGQHRALDFRCSKCRPEHPLATCTDHYSAGTGGPPHSIAVINLKKSPGSHVANEPAIYVAAGADRELLRKQWALYVAVSLFAEAALDPIFLRAR